MSKNLGQQRVSAPLPPKKETTKKSKVEEEVTSHQPVEDVLADEAANGGQAEDDVDASSQSSESSDSESSDGSSDDADPQASRSRAWASRQATQAESVMAAAHTKLKQILAGKKPNEAVIGRAFIALEDRAAKLDSNYRPSAVRGVSMMHSVADLHCRLSAIEQRKHKRAKPAKKSKKSSSKKQKKEEKEDAGAATTAPVSPPPVNDREEKADEKMAEAVNALVA